MYAAVQLGYCFGLKHEPVIDLCIVASGFLLRSIAGGVAARIPLSQWFLLVTAFGSLFMVAGKRYAEIRLFEKTGAKIRASLRKYSSSYLRFVWATSVAIVITTYSLWAFETPRSTPARCGRRSPSCRSSIALLRYAVDVDGGNAGEPDEIVLRDRVLQVLGVCLGAHPRLRLLPAEDLTGTARSHASPAAAAAPAARPAPVPGDRRVSSSIAMRASMRARADAEAVVHRRARTTGAGTAFGRSIRSWSG